MYPWRAGWSKEGVMHRHLRKYRTKLPPKKNSNHPTHAFNSTVISQRIWFRTSIGLSLHHETKCGIHTSIQYIKNRRHYGLQHKQHYSADMTQYPTAQHTRFKYRSAMQLLSRRMQPRITTTAETQRNFNTCISPRQRRQQ